VRGGVEPGRGENLRPSMEEPVGWWIAPPAAKDEIAAPTGSGDCLVFAAAHRDAVRAGEY